MVYKIGIEMDGSHHKVFDILEHIWPYLSGITLTMIAITKLWWNDKKEIKRRINALESLAEVAVTKAELYECRDSVDKQDADNLEKILTEIKEIRHEAREEAIENSKAHQSIMEIILGKHPHGH